MNAKIFSRFVLVNDRAPREGANLCAVRQGYRKRLRPRITKRLLYCDTQCVMGHTKMAKLAGGNNTRKVS